MWKFPAGSGPFFVSGDVMSHFKSDGGNPDARVSQQSQAQKHPAKIGNTMQSLFDNMAEETRDLQLVLKNDTVRVVWSRYLMLTRWNTDFQQAHLRQPWLLINHSIHHGTQISRVIAN